jgi:MoxR-like ATPase
MSDDKVRTVNKIIDNISSVFVGKENQIRTMIVGFLSGLHVLIEDVPGVGKTTLAKCLASSVDLDFGRIQFTPDLLPGDIVGMTTWNQEKREFMYKAGAIMHQFILADEINRASPRTQSSLLEAMEERRVTVDGVTYNVPEPFFVIATQNPVHFVGAFPLPENQVDRFGISFSMGYPTEENEVEILTRFQTDDPLATLQPVCTPEQIREIRMLVRKVHVEEAIKKFIIKLSGETRRDSLIKLGLSPRASQHLLLAAQTRAFMEARDFVIPEDVIEVAHAVLAHRLILSAEARMENKNPYEIIDTIKSRIPIPTGLKVQ